MSATLANLELPPVVTVGNEIFETEPLKLGDEMQQRVGELGAELADHYAVYGEVHVLAVMNGAFHFASDLRRTMQAAEPWLNVTSDQIRLKSYEGEQSSGDVRILYPLSESIRDKHVLVVEDVLDTGQTLEWLLDHLQAEEPASVEVAVAVNKDVPSRPYDLFGATVLHVGFDIPNKFVVGYGLDYEERFRDLPGVHVLTKVDSVD